MNIYPNSLGESDLHFGFGSFSQLSIKLRGFLFASRGFSAIFFCKKIAQKIRSMCYQRHLCHVMIYSTNSPPSLIKDKKSPTTSSFESLIAKSSGFSSRALSLLLSSDECANSKTFVCSYNYSCCIIRF